MVAADRLTASILLGCVEPSVIAKRVLCRVSLHVSASRTVVIGGSTHTVHAVFARIVPLFVFTDPSKGIKGFTFKHGNYMQIKFS